MSPHTPTTILATCIEQSLAEETQEFQWETFFRHWFREHGTPLFFLFKRHLGVTNLQYVELLALINTHCVVTRSGANAQPLMFHTTEQMKNTVVDASNMLLDVAPTSRREAIDEFANRYIEVFASTCAVDMFFCSCALFLPPGLSIDIRQVCADSGYIHSAGRSVFVRRLSKARQLDFYKSLAQHLRLVPAEHTDIPFVVYAHEDFSPHDKASKEQIGRGIEYAKLHVEKMSMGTHRLTHVLSEMHNQEFSGRLRIPPPGNYQQVHDFKTERTIWLISDRSASVAEPTVPGRERYYICYDQTVVNENPFFLFDENKPAWKSHTTLPQSLTAALINATRPHREGTAVCDPFGGTGTTWFEVRRLVPSSIVRCSDLSPVAPQLSRDNLEFFLMDSRDLSALHERLAALSKSVAADKTDPLQAERQDAFDFVLSFEDSNRNAPYLEAVSLLNELKREQPEQDQEFDFSRAFVQRFSRLTFFTRFLFYVALRAELRFQGGYKRKSVTFQKAFCSSLDELQSQIQQLIDLRLTVERDPSAAGTYVAYRGKYSTGVVPSILLTDVDVWQERLDSEITGEKNACDIDPDSVDVIVCDPPYGFNTTEGLRELTQLYCDFLDTALAAIRNDGHLIICLPAESYTGRDLPYCTRSNLITNQVLMKAKALHKDAFLPARSIPSRTVGAPYYWEAERALRRTILHFRIRSLV